MDDWRSCEAREVRAVLQVVRFEAQAVSRMEEVVGAEVRAWKKEVESRRRSEMAWQEVRVVLDRRLWKKVAQVVVVKLLVREVSKAVGNVDDDVSVVSVDMDVVLVVVLRGCRVRLLVSSLALVVVVVKISGDSDSDSG